jgi:hypothetical protein
MIVGLGHQAQVGKDTAAAILVNNYGFKRLAFADRLKEMALGINPIVRRGGATEVHLLATVVKLVGWEEAKKIRQVREFLQRLGVAARDHLGPDVWVNVVIDQVYEAIRTGDNVVVTDVRFPNEFDALAAWGTMIKITRESAPSAGTHVSETALADFSWDRIIENNGSLVELEKSLRLALDL